MDTWIISLVAFGAVTAGVYIILKLTNRHSMCVDTRLANLRGVSKRERGQRLTRLSDSLPKVFNGLLPDSDRERKRFQEQLHQAGIYSTDSLGKFFATKVVFMVVPPIAGLIVGLLGVTDVTRGLLYGALAGCFGFLLPTLWLKRSIARRHRALRKSLPDFLDLMVVCLESGMSLQGALQRVTEELSVAHADLGREMGAVQQDIELGASVDQALRRFAERSGNDEVRTLSAFVREAVRFGTEVSDALRMHAEMLRSQREQTVEELAQKAAVKILAPTLLLIFPTVFVVLAGPAIIQIQEAFTK